MNARTHDILALASLVTVATYVEPFPINIPTFAACLVGNVVGALLPDMDQASNRLWDLVPAGNVVGKVFRRAFLGHRTISHSILGGFILWHLMLIGLPIFFHPDHINIYLVMVSVMIGFLSHLVGDVITKEGIPLFFPFPIKIGIPPFRFLRITTGKFVENFVIFPLLGIYIVWVFAKYQTVILTWLRQMY